MARSRKQYPLDFRTRFGVATMGISHSIGTAMVTSALMLFLTDYAGLYTGVAGAAAAAAATMLVVGRVWDAVNDPLLGYLMDRTPRTRWGRFKPYIAVAIPTSALMLIALFHLPLAMDDALKLVLVYVLYLLFDTAFTLMPFNPLMQTMSPDPRVRSKLLGPPRIIGLVAAAFMVGLIPAAYALGPAPGETNFGLAVTLFLVPAAAISLIGILMVKEGDANVGEETVRLSDLAVMIRTNKPFWISQLAAIFQGFTWTMLFAGANYYIKYALGVEAFPTTSAILGLVMIVGNILGVPASQLLFRWFTPAQAFIWVCVFTALPFALLFFINLGGPITDQWILFPLLFLVTLALGMAFIPGTVVGMQTADYNKFRMAKSMQGTLGALAGFIQKMQAALSAAAMGAILVSVGYDAEAFETAEVIPAELFSGLGLVLFGVPAIMALIGAGIMYFYPLRQKDDQAAMYAEIEEMKKALGAAGTPGMAGVAPLLSGAADGEEEVK
ncbi:MFS transporter [Tessaracoccus defluvii]|uniref:MFS transporter n=1 Tax=Tessaracoccus defluvii TaxID=1285901 RepID=A0A7H0H4H0_9ACTN|nr:MFS transporter [Tessaracoccus defluvii]QNP55436.1 MFS transporter [Tessaracoccus defluvii]